MLHLLGKNKTIIHFTFLRGQGQIIEHNLDRNRVKPTGSFFIQKRLRQTFWFERRPEKMHLMKCMPREDSDKLATPRVHFLKLELFHCRYSVFGDSLIIPNV